MSLLPKKKKKNAQLAAAITVAAILHAVLLVVVGGYTVYRFVKPKEPEFEAPPQLKPLEPRKLEYKMKTQDRQKESNKPRQKRIQVKAISNINLPNVTISSPNVSAAVDVGVGAAEIGNSGLSATGLRMGVSAVDFFGVKARGERIVIIVDIARSMLAPERGDVPGFQRVKEEVGKVIQGLNSATLFNLMVYESDLDVMSEALIVATEANKQRALDFFKPYWDVDASGVNIVGRRGTFLRNYMPDFGDVPVRGRHREAVSAEDDPVRGGQQWGGGSRFDMALLASFEQRADAIFVITDGTPSLTRDLMGREIRDFENAFKEWETRRARVTERERAAYEVELAAWRQRNQQFRQNIDSERQRRGLGELVRDGPVQASGHPMPPEGWRPVNGRRIGGDDFFIKWMHDMVARYYKDRRSRPSLNIVGYSVDRPTEEFLKALQRGFPGSAYRTIGDPTKEINERRFY